MTPKQRAFAYEYVKDRNGTAAATRAGFSAGRAHATASELIRKPDVAELIAQLERELQDEIAVTAADLLREQLWYHEQVKAGGDVPASVGQKALEAVARLSGLDRQLVRVEHIEFVTMDFQTDLADVDDD